MVEKRLEFWPTRSPVAPIAFVTMARDEEIFLRAWIENGLRIHADAAFYVLDHASVSPLADTLRAYIDERSLNVSFVRIPAVPFDDDFKAMALSNLAKMLVHSHEVVVSSDCDELLVGLGCPMSELYSRVLACGNIVAPVGFEIVQHAEKEGDFDPTVPVSTQRRFGFFAAGYTKPVIWRRRTEFGAGLHRVRDEFEYERSLALLHLRSVDVKISNERAALRRQFDLSDGQIAHGRDAHWRRPVEQKVDLFKKLIGCGALPNASDILPGFMDELGKSYGPNTGGFWGHNINAVSEFCDLGPLLS
jgi:hypothetical protein